MEENKDTSNVQECDAVVTTSDQTTEVEDAKKNGDAQQADKPKVKKRFEVEIYDKISVGEPPYEKIQLQKVKFDQPVIIEASSQKDLKDFENKLSLCKQTFKIVKVLDDVQMQAPQTQNIAMQQAQLQQQANRHMSLAQPKSKPKYYKIGSIEIKNDNGKIYQKQWLKLTDEELSNFRIVSNKTNAIVPLKDKSIEMKKWVLVESDDDTSASIEENMR